jgi:hypothetical protein
MAAQDTTQGQKNSSPQKQYIDISSNLVPEVDEFSFHVFVLKRFHFQQSGFQKYWARLWQYPLLPVGMTSNKK